jgi:hypothetical protein
VFDGFEEFDIVTSGTTIYRSLTPERERREVSR